MSGCDTSLVWGAVHCASGEQASASTQTHGVLCRAVPGVCHLILQVCISSVLQRHGALTFSLMMTSRQCVSVLLSTLLFGHALSLSQW